MVATVGFDGDGVVQLEGGGKLLDGVMVRRRLFWLWKGVAEFT